MFLTIYFLEAVLAHTFCFKRGGGLLLLSYWGLSERSLRVFCLCVPGISPGGIFSHKDIQHYIYHESRAASVFSCLRRAV